MANPILLYLDPGTGATLAQLALAGTAGIAAAFKLRMKKVKRQLGQDVDEPQEQLQDSEQIEESTPHQ